MIPYYQQTPVQISLAVSFLFYDWFLSERYSSWSNWTCEEESLALYTCSEYLWWPLNHPPQSVAFNSIYPHSELGTQGIFNCPINIKSPNKNLTCGWQIPSYGQYGYLGLCPYAVHWWPLHVFSPPDLGVCFCIMKDWWHYLCMPSCLTFSGPRDPCL